MRVKIRISLSESLVVRACARGSLPTGRESNTTYYYYCSREIHHRTLLALVRRWHAIWLEATIIMPTPPPLPPLLSVCGCGAHIVPNKMPASCQISVYVPRTPYTFANILIKLHACVHRQNAHRSRVWGTATESRSSSFISLSTEW